MNYKQVAIALFGLWVVTITFFAFQIINGKTKTLEDSRVEIQLTPSEREFMLKRMRDYLQAIKGIVHGINNNRMELVEDGGRIGGVHTEEKEPSSLKFKVPLEYKKMATRLQVAFDDLALAAQKGESRRELLGRLSDHMNICISCHSMYRITVPAK